MYLQIPLLHLARHKVRREERAMIAILSMVAKKRLVRVGLEPVGRSSSASRMARSPSEYLEGSPSRPLESGPSD